MEWNSRIRQLRKHLGMNQIDFAESLGLKQGSYSDIERGRSGLSNHVKMSLSEKYRVNMDWLISGEGDMFVEEVEKSSMPENVVIQNINSNTEIQQRVRMLIKDLNSSVSDFALKVGTHQSTLSRALAEGNTFGEGLINKIVIAFGINKEWLMTGNGDMYQRKQVNEVQSLGDFVVMNVPLVNQYAYGGYLSGYQDETYVAQLPMVPFVVDHEAQGRYLAFEYRGDSMNDGSGESYNEGDVLLCREVEMSLWCHTKLHMKKWDFVIVHEEGILIKRIIDHDVENHTITIHSLNPLFKDRVIDLREVKQIFNVVKLQRTMKR